MRATALIQVDFMVCQAASASPVVSATMVSTVTGGLLQSLVPTRGVVLVTIYDFVYRNLNNRYYGFSARCVRD